MPISIREALPEDAAAISDLRNQHHMVIKGFLAANSRYWLAEEAGEIVGVVRRGIW